jgi:hypothetical protein
MSNDHRVLRAYIKESLILNEKIDVSGLKKAAKGLVGFGDSSASGPQKWLANFMKKKLDDTGEHLSKYLGQKLMNILPDEMQQVVLSSQMSVSRQDDSREDSLGEALAKIVDGWIEQTEKIGESIPKAKKKEIVDFATEVYVKAIKKNPKGQKLALIQVTRELDAKYGSQKSEKKI